MKLWTNTFTHRVLGKGAFGVAMLACALAAAMGPGTDGAAASTVASAPAELPSDWDGQPVRPLALSAVEQRFAQAFPGHIARLTAFNFSPSSILPSGLATSVYECSWLCPCMRRPPWPDAAWWQCEWRKIDLVCGCWR